MIRCSTWAFQPCMSQHLDLAHLASIQSFSSCQHIFELNFPPQALIAGESLSTPGESAYHARMHRLILCIGLLLVACKGSGPEKKSEQGDPAAVATSDKALLEAADKVLQELAALEKEKDVTCWTSFRQLDWFIAEKSYSEFATLAKVTAVKALVRGLWVKAAAQAKGGPVTASHIEAVAALPEISVSEPVQKEFATFTNDIGLKNYTDYQKTPSTGAWFWGLSRTKSHRAEGSRVCQRPTPKV